MGLEVPLNLSLLLLRLFVMSSIIYYFTLVLGLNCILEVCTEIRS